MAEDVMAEDVTASGDYRVAVAAYLNADDDYLDAILDVSIYERDSPVLQRLREMVSKRHGERAAALARLLAAMRVSTGRARTGE